MYTFSYRNKDYYICIVLVVSCPLLIRHFIRSLQGNLININIFADEKKKNSLPGLMMHVFFN